MNVVKLILPTAALGLAGILLVPTQSDAFTVIGTSLSTSQRHFKIFDNFTDVQANNNVTPDTNFPGYTGVEMAIWKAAVEWGSRLHGNGNGDPSQLGNLGSGGANFDFYFMGNATGVGVIGDNICSEIGGSSGGVLAFTEYFNPGFSGWRMRFFQAWTWADGPTTGIPGSELDIQGVACHELGHALGLDHSAVAGATMWPSVSGTGTAERSISADDILGVQNIYSVASASKPIITGYTAALGTVTINGSGFLSSGNQVWFTKATAGTGTSVVVGPLNSSGTSITASVPVNAGPGDILVKTTASGGASLSNAWPFTPGTAPVCPSPFNYCFVNPNSASPTGAEMGWQGSQFISQNNFAVEASGMPFSTAGIFFYGTSQTAAPFGNGWLCATGSIVRLPIVITSIFGTAFYQLDLTTAPVAGTITAGNTYNFQYWFRDVPGGAPFFNLTDGLAVPFCP
ncbi:MAG: matrixin family metalloprotease [Planctomycetota bacterium]|nr:matrixin family metalloprotease [Planctomycetota bacterium]